jgi:hypothetical protein
MIESRFLFNFDAVERTAFASILGGKTILLPVGWDAVQTTISGDTAM